MTTRIRHLLPTCRIALVLAALAVTTAGAHGVGHDDAPEQSSELASDAQELVAAAHVAQRAHRFDEAADLLTKATELEPDNDAAWLMTASLHLLKGRTGEAQAACRRIGRLPLLAVLTCRARVRIGRGEYRQALSELETALAVAPVDRAEPTWRAWATSVAGDAARTIDAQLAAHYYRSSLEVTHNEQVQAALVDVLLDLDDLNEANEALGTSQQSLALRVRRLIVDRRLGRDTGDAVETLDSEFRRNVGAGDYTHGREMARFYLDVLPDAAIAARLAGRNFSVQRELEDRVLCERSGGCDPDTQEVRDDTP